jgi:3-hydroxybutyrate dehydrogenase
VSKARPLEGRSALVTGAVGGIGAAIAAKLAEAGASVVISGLEAPAEIEPARAKLQSETGSRIEYRRADLRDINEIENVARDAAQAVGPISILVNNAVIRHFAPIDKFEPANWNTALAVNVSAPFHFIRLLLPGMRASGYGRIFNFTSVYGSHGTVDRIDYVTSKSAIEGITRATAMECADGVVTCHALCPGTVLTPNIEARVKALAEKEGLSWDQASAKFLEGKQPSARFVESDSVASVMLLLCGPVGRDMNGAIVPIEGGWLAKA